MIENVLHPRIIENKDWATILFVFSFALVAITKSVFENRFSEFSRLMVSDKYIKIYRDTSQLMSWFNIILFVVQMISFAFFIQIILNYYGYASKKDAISYLQIITFLSVFVLSKFLVEKIIATLFDIEEFEEQFNLHKVSYRTYISLALLPVNVVLFYSNYQSKKLILSIVTAVLIINLWTYLVSLKNYQNLLLAKIFYFILYLCTLEIAPYYFMYYWYTKN